ncbi:DUF4271 domain-containing protein [Taibaiella lutea]|uniref:DUF4271 domain-containing protein n=1 Tax=Taibaiella lutea TaxID=2608001 RepID=A0A5M6CVJ9_9BACT|nr:DUF4271 domain-containing protein [Taibaiella lutea]KAA5537239.1 DUF4271 domain-containing protein [Taibaiella lutea]
MRLTKYLLLLFSFLLCSVSVRSRVLYGYNIPEQVLEVRAKEQFKKDMAHNPILTAKTVTNAIERPHKTTDRSFDFLIILLLITAIAVFRFSNPTYFKNLFRAFRNQTLSARQLKDQISQNSAAGLAMDLVFCISMALYLYYAIAHLQHNNFISRYSDGIILLAIVLLFSAVYVIRYLFLKFTGWVFNISEITDNYTFNVFLINKIMGILIIPFTIVLAFGQGAWVQAALFLSLVFIVILFLNRYLRSGVVFGYFIKFSKFHFFMYLCASELLPLAVLMKVIKQCFFS